MTTTPCKAEGCGAQITWALNELSSHRIPLVPFVEGYKDAFRYKLTTRDSMGQMRCQRDNAGEWMSHYASCTNPGAFSRSNRK